MADQPTIGALIRSGEVTEADLAGVTAGWLEDRVEGPIPIGKHAVDVTKAVGEHGDAWLALEDPDASEDTKLRLVTEAVVRAQAEPA